MGQSRWREECYVKDSWNSSPIPISFQDDGTYTYEIRITSNEYSVYGGSGLTYITNKSLFSDTSNVVIKLMLGVGGSGSECNSFCLRMYWDNERLRKYSSPEPSAILGLEEIVS